MSDFKNYSEEDLVGFVLTGFPLAKQKSALLEIVKRLCVSEHDIINLACNVEGKNREQVKDVLYKDAKKRNGIITTISEYL